MRHGRQEVQPVQQDHRRPGASSCSARARLPQSADLLSPLRPVPSRPQRIDLFGAKKQDLPAIWGELIAAGFESGHAYGKSLRTVKSCVGSSWCRYGVGDSVGLAVQLENRYKGVRSPHKFKGGLSGCVRECGEGESSVLRLPRRPAGRPAY